jgi:hypothetical protein
MCHNIAMRRARYAARDHLSLYSASSETREQSFELQLPTADAWPEGLDHHGDAKVATIGRPNIHTLLVDTPIDG